MKLWGGEKVWEEVVGGAGCIESQREDRGPTTCRGWECALGTGVTCWEPV